jgi:hypothetical protein
MPARINWKEEECTWGHGLRVVGLWSVGFIAFGSAVRPLWQEYAVELCSPHGGQEVKNRDRMRLWSQYSFQGHILHNLTPPTQSHFLKVSPLPNSTMVGAPAFDVTSERHSRSKLWHGHAGVLPNGEKWADYDYSTSKDSIFVYITV